jgi:hypothetical protein
MEDFLNGRRVKGLQGVPNNRDFPSRLNLINGLVEGKRVKNRKWLTMKRNFTKEQTRRRRCT